MASQFPFPYPRNSPYPFSFPHFPNSQFETQQSPVNIQNSPDSQVPAFANTNFVDLNDDYEENEDVRENTGHWTWVEDKLLISAWLNVSIDPLIGTDQKAEAFWDRIKQYCEEDNPGVIKRGVVAMRKRWQRINEGAQKFGSCYDEAQRMIGSGSNLDNIIEKAHELHLAQYKKKTNFDNHWRELRRHPKWRTPTTSASSKRTKLSSSGAYSSEGNNDTPTSDEFELVRPKGTKAAKRKGKGKATTAEVEEYEAIQVNDLRKMNIMDTINEMKQKEIETRQRIYSFLLSI
nr:PREDICTED: glutathione S-transferase T3-like [Daucus carota subsp. sativus]